MNEDDINVDDIKTYVQKNGKKVVVTCVVGTIVMMFVFGSTLVVNGVILGTLTAAGFVMFYQRLPKKVRNFINRWSILADIAISILTYWMLGKTATAVLAAAVVEVLTSAFFSIFENRRNGDFATAPA